MAKKDKDLEDFFKKDKDPDELKEYVDHIKKGDDPVKTTRLDKIALFFKNIADRIKMYYYGDGTKSKRSPSNMRRRARIIYRRLKKKATEKFHFESGVDILDDKSVLYRRNRVIKNILIVTNVVFLIFTIVGSQDPNYIVIFGFGVLMFAINTTLKRIIRERPRTLLKQQMAMYIASVYVLLASIGVYIKLVVGVDPTTEGGDSIALAGYALVYFALVVIALYQDAKLLRFLFKWVLVLMTIVHVLVMYPLYEYAGSIEELYNFLIIDNPSVTIDILLRTLVLIVFHIALFSSVAIGEMMNNKRKEELLKRRDMESDFKAVVGDVFDVISVFNPRTDESQKHSAYRVAEMASRLGDVLGLSPNVCSEIYDYSKIHIDKVKDLSIVEYEDKEVLDEKDYQVIREKTILGSVIIKRLQLNQKSEDIVRAHFEKTADKSFIERMKRIQRTQEGQIILLAEIYDILRQPRNYKTSLNHKRAKELLELEFKDYFEPYILDRFLKYSNEFESYYKRYQQKLA